MDVMGMEIIPDYKVHGVNMGPIWGRQDPGGPHVGPINFAIWDFIPHFITDEIAPMLGLKLIHDMPKGPW